MWKVNIIRCTCANFTINLPWQDALQIMHYVDLEKRTCTTFHFEQESVSEVCYKLFSCILSPTGVSVAQSSRMTHRNSDNIKALRIKVYLFKKFQLWKLLKCFFFTYFRTVSRISVKLRIREF